MYIFQKRPLSFILCVMLGGFFVFSVFNGFLRYLPIVFSLILALLPFIFKELRSKKTLLLVAAASLLISILASFLYFDLYFKAEKRFDDEVTVEAVVLSIEPSTSYSSSLLIRSENINGEPFSEYKFYMNMKSTEITQIEVGDKISFKAMVDGFEYEGDFDAKAFFYSDGISANLTNIEELSLIEKGNKTLYFVLDRAREILRRKAVLLSDEQTGNLTSALLTGERDELSSELKQDFRRIGISHILALSGMHLAILSLAVSKLLRLVGTNKYLHYLTIILFSVAYMIFVGFSVSVVRAGIMLILSSLLHLFSERSDSFNSLCIAVFLIILITPYAIFDLSLWLSAFATLGVIVSFNRQLEKDTEKTKLRKFLDFLYLSIKSSVYATGATVLISAVSFGGFSLFSPITTFIFSLIIELYMYLGSIMLILGLIFSPLSLPFAFIQKHLTVIIKSLAAFFSEPDIAYLDTNYEILYVLLIIFSVLFFSLLIVKLNKRVVSAVILCSFSLLLATATVFKLDECSRDSLVYSSENKGDLFILNSKNERALISSSQYSKSLAYKAVSFLRDNHINKIDKYIVTHYAYPLEEEFDILLSNILIEEISIPHPKNEDEERLYKLLIKKTEACRTKLSLHAEGGVITIGDFDYFPLYSNAYGTGASHNAFKLCYKNKESCLYLSSGMLNEEFYDLYDDIISNTSAIIFGSHGKKYKDDIYIEEVYAKAEKIILAGESVYFSQITYQDYIKNGCDIYSHPKTVKLFEFRH